MLVEKNILDILSLAVQSNRALKSSSVEQVGLTKLSNTYLTEHLSIVIKKLDYIIKDSFLSF